MGFFFARQTFVHICVVICFSISENLSICCPCVILGTLVTSNQCSYNIRIKHITRLISYNFIYNCSCFIITVCHNICKFSKYRSKQTIIKTTKTENSSESYRCILGFNNSLFNRKVYRNRNYFILIFAFFCSSVSNLFHNAHLLVCHDFFKCNRNERLARERNSTEKSPNCTIHPSFTIFVITNNGLYESITDNRIGVRSTTIFKIEILTINCNHALDEFSFCIVELCICIVFICKLLICRICSKESVHRCYNNIHKCADGNTFRFAFFSECVHNTNLHQFNVRVHCDDCIVCTHIVENHGKTNVNCYVSELTKNFIVTIAFRHNSCNVCHKLFLEIKDQILCSRIEFTDCRFNLVDSCTYNRRTVKAYNIKDSAETKYTKVTVTNTDRNEVSIGYHILIVLCDKSNLHSTVLTVSHISCLVKSCGILKSFDVFDSTLYNVIYSIAMFILLSGIIVICTTIDKEECSICSGVVANLVKCPEVTRCECGVPKCFTFFATICPLIIAFNEFLDNSYSILIVVIKFKKPVNVFNSHT